MNILNSSLSQWMSPRTSNKTQPKWAAKCEILIGMVFSTFFLCFCLSHSVFVCDLLWFFLSSLQQQFCSSFLLRNIWNVYELKRTKEEEEKKWHNSVEIHKIRSLTFSFVCVRSLFSVSFFLFYCLFRNCCASNFRTASSTKAANGIFKLNLQKNVKYAN